MQASGISPNVAAIQALEEARAIILSEQTQNENLALLSSSINPKIDEIQTKIFNPVPSIPEKVGPQGISGEEFAELIVEATSMNTIVALIRTVGRVFSDHLILGISFYPPEGAYH